VREPSPVPVLTTYAVAHRAVAGAGQPLTAASRSPTTSSPSALSPVSSVKGTEKRTNAREKTRRGGGADATEAPVPIDLRFPDRPAMASSSDPWMKEYNEASRLADDINSMIADRGSLPQSGPEIIRHTSAIRRKITILCTRLDSLEALLSKIPPKSLSDKELHKRQDTLSNLKSKTKQMATSFNMSNFANREDLLGQNKKAADDMSRVAGLDNQGIVGLQRQIMKEQDEGLEKLEETVLSTKHIALAVNEELTLHTRLIDDLEDHVDVTNSRLQRVQKRLAILNKRTKGGCSCMCLLLSVVAIVILAVIVWLLIKYM
jgi:SYP5 family syntaxin